MCDIKLERDYLGLEGNREMGEGQDRAIDGYVDGYGWRIQGSMWKCNEIALFSLVYEEYMLTK